MMKHAQEFMGREAMKEALRRFTLCMSAHLCISV